jgi:hypothetical protein
LTILKQARAHGVGMIVSTQNPVDLDYKAMSNAGTWMIGRLQTENDKRRILEGLDSATGGANLSELSRLISGLDKRQFVLHTAKGKGPKMFGTRWAMSYLAGPLTRDQVSSLMAEIKAGAKPAAVDRRTPEHATEDDVVPLPPTVAKEAAVTYLDPAAPWADEVGAIAGGKVHEAALAVRVGMIYDDTAARLDHREEFEAVIYPLDGRIDPEEVLAVDHDDRDFRTDAPEGARYRLPDVDLAAASFWTGVQNELKAYLVAHRPLRLHRNAALKLYSRPDETREGFARRCSEVAEAAADEQVAKLNDRYAARISRVRDQIEAARIRMLTAEQEHSARKQSEFLSGAGDLLGTLIGGRSRSNPLGQAASRREATHKARARAEAEATKVSAKERELVELEDELADEIAAIVDRTTAAAAEIDEVDVPLEKSDIEVRELKLVWIPVA